MAKYDQIWQNMTEYRHVPDMSLAHRFVQALETFFFNMNDESSSMTHILFQFLFDITVEVSLSK